MLLLRGLWLTICCELACSISVLPATLSEIELPSKAQALLREITDYEVVTVAIRKREGAKISVYFKAFREEFYLMFLPIEHSVYRNLAKKGLSIQTSGGQTNLKYLAYYVGNTFVTNHEGHGHFKSNGMFNGVVHFANKTDFLYVEPAAEYFDGRKYTKKAVVYKMSQKTGKEKGGQNVVKPSFQTDTSDKIESTTQKPNSTKVNIGRHCKLSIVVDHLFFERRGESDYQNAVDEVLMYIVEMDKFYRKLDLLGEGKPSNIGFEIVDFRVIERHDKDYHFGDDIKNATDLLYSFSRLAFHDVCLGVLFTHRKLEGTLGSAWVRTDIDRNRGICSKKAEYRGVELSLNTLTISTYASQAHVFDALTHELGHSFGAHHDNPDVTLCSPGGKNGNYIMRDEGSDVSKFKPNHLKYSPCSLQMIQELARQHVDCFEKDLPVCGNGVVEDGEECDCGLLWKCMSIQPWCIPAGGTAFQKGCRLRIRKGKKECNPAKEACCTLEGLMMPAFVKKKCREESECTPEGMCLGNSTTCPMYVTYDGRRCEKGAGVCHDGICSHDLTYVNARSRFSQKDGLYYNQYNAIRGTKVNQLALTIGMSSVLILILGIVCYLSCLTGDHSTKGQCYRIDEERRVKICCYCCVIPDQPYERVDSSEHIETHQTKTQEPREDVAEEMEKMPEKCDI